MAVALRASLPFAPPRAPASLRALRRAPVATPRAASRRVATLAMAAAAKRVLVPIANGSEEIEAVSIVDVLRRAGADVTVASVEPMTLLCKMSRGVLMQADVCIADVATQSFDLVALPGGMPGAERLRDSKELTRLLQAHAVAGRPYAAMCAAPAVVLAPLGLLAGRAATAHPAFSDKLPASCAAAVPGRVVADGPVLTSRGPGTALEFALALVARLYGEDKAKEVAGPMVMHPHAALPPLGPHEWRMQ